MKKLVQIQIAFLCLLSFSATAQSEDAYANAINKTAIKTFTNYSFSEVEYSTYSISLFGLNHNAFDITFNLRFEDQLNSETTYIIKDEVAFLDINISQSIAKLDFSFTLENLFNLKDNTFEIEPNLVNNTVQFSHEANFLLSASVVYNF